MPERRHDRVVIDTDILVSHCVNDTIDELVVLITDPDITLYTCLEQFEELENALNYDRVKKYLAAPPNQYLKLLKKISTTIIIDKRFDRVSDPNDNYLFDLAYAAKSYFLNSGDNEVLKLKQVNRIRVISWSEYKRILKASIKE